MSIHFLAFPELHIVKIIQQGFMGRKAFINPPINIHQLVPGKRDFAGNQILRYFPVNRQNQPIDSLEGCKSFAGTYFFRIGKGSCQFLLYGDADNGVPCQFVNNIGINLGTFSDHQFILVIKNISAYHHAWFQRYPCNFFH